MSEDINKLSKSCENLFGNMTADEFQSKLYVWFEEKGILSDLRTHLRHQMINALKTTEIGRKVNSEQKLNFNLSPKYQALNLIIAEYLLQQGYHYALSVFSSEVPMLSSLPRFARPANSGGDPKDRIKFKERDVWDILEALGLPTGSEEAQIIYSAYQSDLVNDTLLVCLIRMLPRALKNKENINIMKSPDPHNFQSVRSNGQATDERKLETDKINGNTPPSRTSTKKEKKDSDCGAKQKNFKKSLDLSISNSDSDCSKNYPNFCDVENKAKETERSVLSAIEIENVLTELHERMQKAFDHELEVARREEWQKCSNVIETREKEIERELELEKTKIKKIEIKTKDKMQRELELEKVKLTEQQKIKQLEMEKTLGLELELERYKLMNEYRQIVQNKGGDFSELIQSQQNNLAIALEKVERQSKRLKEKEDLLNKRLNDIEDTFKKKYKSVSKETSDVASQSCHTDEERRLTKEKKSIEILKTELELLREKLDSDTSAVNKSKNSTIDKEVQTTCSKNVQTSLESGNTESDKSIDDFEKLLQSRNKLRNNSNKLATKSKCKNDVDFIKIQGVASNIEYQNQTNSKFNEMGGSENPLGYVLNTLHQENTYLKAFTAQQRQQIQELISKQMCMGKEASEANAQVQELSAQLAELGRLMKTSQSDKSKIKPAAGTPYKRVSYGRESREKNNAQEKKSSRTPTYSGKSTTIEETKRKTILVVSSDESMFEETPNRRRSPSNSRKPPRRLRKGNKPTVNEDDTSPTDDVLKDAKKRLQMLELESDAVDRSYQEFKRRHSVANIIESIPKIKEDFSRKSPDFAQNSISKSVYFHGTGFTTKTPSTTIGYHKGLSNSRIRLDLQTNLKSLVPKQIPYCEKEQQDQSPTYNVLRRVHEPTMNIDKNVLQNYISTVDKMKKFSSRSPNTFAKLLVHDKLQRNVRSMHDVSQGNNYTGTTAFLLERIEKCTSNPQRFNTKMFETKRINILSESNVLNKSNMVQGNAGIESANGKVLKNGTGDAKNIFGASNTAGANNTAGSNNTVDVNNTAGSNNTVDANNTVGVNNTVSANNTVNEYEKFIGHSSEQYKIKPLLHWRNLQNNPRDVENGSKTDRGFKKNKTQSVPLLSKHNMPNLEPKNTELTSFAKIKEALNNEPSKIIGIEENLSLLNNVPVQNVSRKPLKVPDRDSVKRRLFVSESSNNAGPSVINESKVNSAAEQNFVDSHEPANSDAVKELTKNLTKILNIKELDNIKMDFIDGTENKQSDVALTKDKLDQKMENIDAEIANLADNLELEENFVEDVLKGKGDNKLLPKDVVNDISLEINIHGLSDMMKDIIFQTTKVVNVDEYGVIAETTDDAELKSEENVASIQNDKLNLTLENVESIAEDIKDVIILEVKDKAVKVNNRENCHKESDVQNPEVKLDDNAQSSVSSEKISVNKFNAINNDSVQEIKSDDGMHTPPVEGFITKEVKSESIEDIAKSIEDAEQSVADVAPAEEADVANDTVLSEELIVPSSIEMSSDQSPISAPQASDDNESFWN